MTPIEEAFAAILPETRDQRDAEGKVRWLYMVNWIVSVLKSQNPNFDAAAFYKAIGTDEIPTAKTMPPCFNMFDGPGGKSPYLRDY